MTDHCGHQRPSYVTIEPEDKEKVPCMFGKPIVRDFSHCPMIESMYYAMFGLLEAECELFTEEDQFPKLVYVATQREAVTGVEGSETKEEEQSLK